MFTQQPAEQLPSHHASRLKLTAVSTFLAKPFCCLMQEQAQAEHAKSQQTPEPLTAQQRILSQLTSLRAKAWQLIHQNEQANLREQLARQDLVVDVEGMAQLKTLGQARVEALRESIRQGGLKEKIIWDRLKAAGWDGMEVQRANLTGIKSSVQVSTLATFELAFLPMLILPHSLCLSPHLLTCLLLA